MENNNNVHLNEQLEPRIMKGDFVILGKILGVEQNTARMRFKRNKEVAVLCMQDIVENRENFISDYALREKSVILDCAIINYIEFLVVIQFDGEVHYNRYETPELMHLRIPKFISEVLKDVPPTTKQVVTDCSIGYLPEVISTIKNFGFKQVFKHTSASKVTDLVQKLTSKN